MSVHLEPITCENWYECSRLQVRRDQKKFVSSALLCIAEVQFYPDWGAFAVYDADRLVGFIMYEHDVEERKWWISSLLIAAKHQQKGFGKAAAGALISHVKQQACRTLWVGYADDNAPARRLYRGLGFQEVGLDDEGDMVARKRLERP